MKIYDVINSLPVHEKRKYPTRNLSGISEVIVHHSATQTGSPESFAKYHVENNNWPGIGYHYVIDTAGKVYKTQPASVASYHTPNHNVTGVGICLIGNFEETTPNQEAVQSLICLCKELIKAYKVTAVLGHKETTKTLCPGKKLDMKKIREELFK